MHADDGTGSFWEYFSHLDQISKKNPSEETLRTEPVTLSNIKCKSLYLFERHRSVDGINKHLNNLFKHLESLAA